MARPARINKKWWSQAKKPACGCLECPFRIRKVVFVKNPETTVSQGTALWWVVMIDENRSSGGGPKGENRTLWNRSRPLDSDPFGEGSAQKFWLLVPSLTQVGIGR